MSLKKIRKFIKLISQNFSKVNNERHVKYSKIVDNKVQ